MSVRLRLRREGTKKKPHYRIVAADRRAPRDGRFIEIIGTYDPQQEPSHIEVDAERALYWLRHGAQPSSQVENLLAITGVWEQFKPGAAEEKLQRSQERAQRAEQRAAQRAEAAAEREAQAATAAQQSGGSDASAERSAAATEDLEEAETATADAAAETDAPASEEGGPGEGVAPGGSAPEETSTEATSEAATADEEEPA